jgi:hypothetical protein
MGKTYRDTNELASALRKVDWQGWFFRQRRKEAESDLKTIIEHSAAGDTFRPFAKLRMRPSRVFREWAYQGFGSGLLGEFLALHSRTSFDSWLEKLSRNFQRYWRARTGKEIPFGPARKLPNLLLKRLCLFRDVEQETVHRLVWFLHVPLDKYSLAAIRYCVPVFPNPRAIGKIPSSPRMGIVRNEEMYAALQGGIRLVARGAQVPPIALDLLSWNAAHPGKD